MSTAEETESVRSAATDGATDGVQRPRLKRELGLWMATVLVIGNMVGSGIFLLPSSLAGTAGPVSILAWVFTGIGTMLLALVFARLGRAYPKTGGPYVYARKAFGDFELLDEVAAAAARGDPAVQISADGVGLTGI